MNGWKRWLPGLQMLSRYEAAWLPHDLRAGRADHDAGFARRYRPRSCRSGLKHPQ